MNAVREATLNMEKKPWNRLDRGIRIRKIREWAAGLSGELYTDSLKDEIETTLVRAIQRKEISTNICVEYDAESCRVVRVPALMFVENPDGAEDAPRVIIKRPEGKTRRRRKV